VRIQAGMCEWTLHAGESITVSIMMMVIMMRVTWRCHSLSYC